MAEKGADLAKIAWIPNGVDLSLVPPPTPPSPNPDGVFTVMYAGSHGLANNLERIVEAAAIITKKGWNNRIQFRLVGDGPEKPHIVQLAYRLGVSNISFEPPVPKSEVYNLLSQSDSFIAVMHDSPLYKWGFSLNKLFDYLAMARPIVWGLSSTSDYDPITEAEAGITVPSNDPTALAEAIIQLAQMSPQVRWEMGLRGRRYVEEKHAFHRLADKLEEVLESSLRVC